MLWVRLAPERVEEWHKPSSLPTDRAQRIEKSNGLRVVTEIYDLSPEDLLTRLDDLASSTPRTKVLAGSVEEGMITYVTRTRLWGFPDYATVQSVPAGPGARLVIHARSRFGGSDWSVNAKRIDLWLRNLDGL